MDLPDADVAVVGDGPAGCIAARLLSEQGWSVALLSRRASAPGRTCEVLSPACVNAIVGWLPPGLLDRAGVARRCAGIRSTSGTDAARYQDYLRDSGFIIDRKLFDGGLREAAVATGARMHGESELRDAEQEADAVVLSGLSGGNLWRLRARFVVDASGRAACVARRLGSGHLRVTRQVAFATRAPGQAVNSKEPAWFDVESGTDEWWTASVAPDGCREYVHYSAPEHGRNVRAALAQRLLSTRLGNEAGTPSRWTGGMDAGTTFALTVRGHRWAAIGDSAAAFDPVSSQGVWNAVSSAAFMAKAIPEFLRCGQTLGLERYEFNLSATISRHLHGLRQHVGQSPLEGAA